MPVVNIGLQRTRDRVIGSGTMNAAVDSIGVGTNDAAEAAGDTRLGAGTNPKDYDTWKSGGALTITTGGDGTADPWWQIEATYATTEANQVLFEIGTSAGTLSGDNPAGNDGTKLYSRKRIGGATGVGKTSDIELIARVKVTY
jgi:hypothetical protein